MDRYGLIVENDAHTMKILFDTHTHSVASGHAYSTIDDLARGARRRGLKGFVLTDHGPALGCYTHPYHFGNLRILPRRIEGVRFFKGIEANILDTEGTIDLGANQLVRLDFVLAGLHEVCAPPSDIATNTRAIVAALANPFVDAISHPGNPAFPVDARAIVSAAVEYGKALEINDSSFRVRTGSGDTCLSIARICAELGALVVCGSDAHYWRDVGRFGTAVKLMRQAGVDGKQVVNASAKRFEAFMERRSAERRAAAGIA